MVDFSDDFPSAARMKRRQVLRGCLAWSLALATTRVAQAQAQCLEAEVTDDAKACLARVQTTAFDWVDAALSTKPFGAPLNILRFADRMYCLNADFEWTPGDPASAGIGKVVVPRGFVTDFASVPRVFWSVLAPDDSYVSAAVVHDWLYWSQTVERRVADNAMRLAMEELPVSSWQITAVYRAVATFGDSAWQDNKARRAGGERRVLRRLPGKATDRWVDWKQIPDVFAD